MILTEATIEHDYRNIGGHAKKTLEAANDVGLIERTIIYGRLRSIADKGFAFNSSVVAQTVADILDSQAWLDYVEVDGQRKSCESFSKWCQENNFDLKLAEFALETEKRDYISLFNTACGHKYLAPGSPELHEHKVQCAKRPRGKNRQPSNYSSEHLLNASSKKMPNSVRWLKRLERLAEESVEHKTLLAEHHGGRAITSIAAELGWIPKVSTEVQIAKRLANKISPRLVKSISVDPYTYFCYLHNYAQAHPEVLEDLLNE